MPRIYPRISGARVQPNNQPAPGSIGNTTGIIVPKTEPNASGNTAPPIKPKPEEKGWWKRWGSDVVHIGLDVAGLIPGVGEIADGANALIYLAEGDKVNAALSAAAMVPGLGMAATSAKYGKKAMVATEAGAKLAKEGAEKAAKETAEEAAERVAKEKAAQKKGGKDKGKKKLKCGEYGKYGDLKKKGGDNKFDRDHIPSKEALKQRAEELSGRSLSDAQRKAIDKAGEAIAIPKQAHIDASPTYGQTKGAARIDSKNLAGSARRDVEAMLKEIDKHDEDGKCKKAYQKAAAKVLRMSNADYDKMLAEILKRVPK